MFKLEQFFAAIDTPGGHIIILGTLVGTGLVMMVLGNSDGNKLVENFSAALFLAMRGRNGAKS